MERRQLMTSWIDSPCVWHSWKCQLLWAERAHADVVVDAVALEPLHSATTVVPAGSPFAVRVARDEANVAALDVLAGWADDLEPVLILGGRHRRQSWMCVSRRHDRLVLTGTAWAVRQPHSRDEADRLPALIGMELTPPTGGPPLVPQRTLIGAAGEPR
jgi:hypothetical protein